jgi:hypothetical protein
VVVRRINSPYRLVVQGILARISTARGDSLLASNTLAVALRSDLQVHTVHPYLPLLVSTVFSFAILTFTSVSSKGAFPNLKNLLLDDDS